MRRIAAGLQAGPTDGGMPSRGRARADTVIAEWRGTGQNVSAMARKHTARAAPRLATRLLVALLLIVGLVAGPAPSSRVAPKRLAFDAALPICHTGTGDAVPQSPADIPSPAADCSVCPACHIVAPPMLPGIDGGFVAMALVAAPSHAAATPPATGPPRPVSPATPPTGPPAASV